MRIKNHNFKKPLWKSSNSKWENKETKDFSYNSVNSFKLNRNYVFGLLVLLFFRFQGPTF